jgi:hypothetical protein
MIVETALAQQLAVLLIPALPYLMRPAAAAGQKAVEAVGGKIGEDAWNKAKEVWSRLKPWADKKPEVASTLKEVADGDPLAKDALARDLKRLLESMPEETVNEIRSIVISKTKSESRVTKADHGGIAVGGDVSDSTIIAGYHRNEKKFEQ